VRVLAKLADRARRLVAVALQIRAAEGDNFN
jgi:hypothetical protein